jgi:hypothetical protein
MQRLEGYVETNISELRSIHSCAVGHFLELVNLICADNFDDRVLTHIQEYRKVWSVLKLLFGITFISGLKKIDALCMHTVI